MPYIKDINNRRQELREGAVAQNAGELNCQIFSYVKYQTLNDEIVDQLVILKYCENFLGKNPNYQRFNDLVGCLYLCEKELSRRSSWLPAFEGVFGVDYSYPVSELIDLFLPQIYNYENKKIEENGDVE